MDTNQLADKSVNQTEIKVKASFEVFSDYDQLSALEKAILQIVSVAYVSVNLTQLINCLMKLNIKAEGGQDFRNGTKNDNFGYLRPTIDHLFKLQLFQGKNRSSLILVPNIVELMTQLCVQENKFCEYLEVVREFILKMPDESSVTPNIFKKEQLVAFIRIFFYQGKKEDIAPFYAKHIKSFRGCPTPDEIFKQLASPYGGTFVPEWFELLPVDTRTAILRDPIKKDILMCSNNARHMEYIEQLLMSNSPIYGFSLKEALLEKWLLCGEKERVKEWLKNNAMTENENSFCLKGSLAFLEGNNKQAIEYFEAALTTLTALTKIRGAYFNNFSGIFYLLALLQENTPQSLEQVQSILYRVKNNAEYTYEEAYASLSYPLAFLKGKSKEAQSIFSAIRNFGAGSFSIYSFLKYFFGFFGYFWIDPVKAKDYLSDINIVSMLTENNGYLWFHNELEALYKNLSSEKSVAAEGGAASSLIGVIQRNNVWEQTINALLALKQSPKNIIKPAINKESAQDLRMVWFIDCSGTGHCVASPREQKLDAKGKWSKGRPIALKNLCLELGKYTYISQQDRDILTHLYAHQYKDGWYTNTEYIFDENYIFSLLGHPLIFLGDGETKVDFVKGKPELLVKQQTEGEFILSLSPAPTKGMSREQYIAIHETQTRIKLVKVDEDYHRIADILGDGITVPASAKEKVQLVIEKLAQDILVNSDLEGEGSHLKEVKADPIIHVLLLPAGHGLKLGLFVRPVKAGAYYAPGSGGRLVISEVRGIQLQTVRDLKQEEENAAALMRECPTLRRSENLSYEWVLEDTADCLEVLFELGKLGKTIVLEWPEGEKFKLLGQASFNHFHLNIKRQQEWFLATGNIQLDSKLVVDMQKLLELTAATKSRFLEIGDGQFIALTHAFQKRLQELNRYSERDGKGVRFHPLAALALESLTDEAGHLITDQDWKDHIIKLGGINEQQFTVPTTLQAELRDYQREGVMWLCRLAHWGVGACLADDMGLGKTLQAMALLLKHAPDGPSLVIAPTSVCMNWLEEAKRFAPTLNLIQFGGGNRAKTLEALGKFDVLVCSYGLLQQAGEMLGAVSWQMVVLDEAQAIKNFFTKRSRAAMNLVAKFKLIMTGTPIENHLGELWNLFHFINPGLLGSLEEFNLKYILPVERDNDPHARLHLKKLIQPVILRRTKIKVLDELPARTEIRLQVELSAEEAAFYEALRQQAVEKLAGDDGGSKHLKILAEIMKLRRACCNTRLVHEDIALPSSKLAVFGEVLEELLENKHKALVFSQFVGHLSLIRKYLEEKNIRYQYLDGATPVKDRKIAVDAFQAGEGDVFLISLKAGGLGLNLTAADYVIHMDPWWNPAVEDQASDRAHRIGQKRPVTIYRLVAKDTIEEKIVEMHHRKRDLADSLLDGSDVSGKLTTEDLLSLLNR